MQSVQAVDETDAVFTLYFPAPQSVQADAADALLYFPAAQSVQAADEVDAVFTLNFPTPQAKQATDEVDPVLGL